MSAEGKFTCAICRRHRTVDQLEDGRVVCKDRDVCNRIAANAMLSGPTAAQMEALRLAGKTKRVAA